MRIGQIPALKALEGIKPREVRKILEQHRYAVTDLDCYSLGMKRLLRALLSIGLMIAAAIFVCRAVFPLPDKNFDEATTHSSASWTSSLGQIVENAVARHEGKTGVLPLSNGRDAFTARALLIQEAQTSIDAQYYIWQNDTTGVMLLNELRAAAERGVRVRLLLDDNGISGLDNMLAELDNMPSAEVRIFNPFTLRKPKLASYLFDFPRLNRRMHNKSITFDGFASIVGGRNIGDIYFEFGKGLHYVDVDVLALGEIVDQISDNFDAYWNSGSVYAADYVLPAHLPDEPSISDSADAARQTARGSGYHNAILHSPLAKGIQEKYLPLEWTNVRLFSDPPTKGLKGKSTEGFLAHDLASFALEAETSVDLVSAYFVPSTFALNLFGQLSENGVATRVLTNSMEATDVAPVHGAYMRKRPALLENGTRLFELEALREKHRNLSLPEILAGSASSLHAKVMSFDRKRAFIGSYNLDPRSAWLNCEMGLLIESPTIATWISEHLDSPRFAYEVKQDEQGALVWISTEDDGTQTTLTSEPNVSRLHRAIVSFSGWLPLDWLL